MQYPKAPITEAVLDIRTILPDSSIGLDELKSLQVDNYPTQQKIMVFEGQFQFGPEVTTSTSQSPIGYTFLTSDAKQRFIASKEGLLSVNWHLMPTGQHLRMNRNVYGIYISL